MKRLPFFKAYDIRGKTPEQLSPQLARALGAALRILGGSRVIVGHDARLSGPMLEDALNEGLQSWGASVRTLGLCGTEEIYDAAANFPCDFGVMITGSHNPANENGFKLVRAGAIPVSADSGLNELEAETGRLLRNGMPYLAEKSHSPAPLDLRDDYLRRIMACAKIEPQTWRKKLKVVADAGNGCAGPVLEKIAALLPVEFIPLHYKPDGSFPNGVPNPLLPERRASAAKAVAENGADLGVAFDGDFDRCFFYDHEGRFLNGVVTATILAKTLLTGNAGQKVIHDPRVYWHIRAAIQEAGCQPVMGKCGHAFIKERMRSENALFGAETSGHYFYREFSFCDSGMITMLLMLSFLQKSPLSLAAMRKGIAAAAPAIEETNFSVPNSGEIMERVREFYAPKATHIDNIDGLNMEFPQWRFSLRKSNTEDLLRLNMETRGDETLLAEKFAEVKKTAGL